MKDEVTNSVRSVAFLSRTGSFFGHAIKSLAKGFGVEWRIAPEYPLPPSASVVLVAPTNDPKILEEIFSKCGVWDAKTMTASACYELILDQSPKAADKAAADDGESLTDWLLSEYFFYGRNEFCFEGSDNMSQSDLGNLEAALAPAVGELAKRVKENDKREKDKR